VVDQGYVSGQTLADSAQMGEDLLGPVPAAHSPQARLPEGLTQDQFTVDLAQGTAFCPAGQSAAQGRQRPDGSWQFHFAAATCAACPLRARCCTGRGGRTLTLGPHHAQLQAARARQQTPEFQACYRQHRGGIEGCLSVLLRGHGLRVNRYIGRAKNNLVCGGRGQPAAGGALVGGGAPPGAAAGVGPGGIGTKTARDTGVEPSQDACWRA